tara:strand:- start:112 stop:300 length:189 start_codon:yes stop_codon:yes gene_type:complete
MLEVISFFRDNLTYIIFGSISLFTLLVIFSMLDIDFSNLANNSPDKNIDKIVTIESMLVGVL